MDNIERLLQEIKEDPEIWKPGRDKKPLFFSGKFLNDVGDIFERHGFGTTRSIL